MGAIHATTTAIISEVTSALTNQQRRAGTHWVLGPEQVNDGLMPDEDARQRGQADRVGVPPLADEDHVCLTCGFSYLATTMAAAIEMIRSSPAAVRGVVTAVSSDVLRRRPAPGVWSVMEYVCHLRDVYATYTIRLHRARTENRPMLEPMFNDLRARRFRYNDRDVGAVLDELTATAGGCCEEINRIGPTDWERVVTRLPGEQRSTRWLVRQAAHEGQHHLRDIRRIVAMPLS